MKLKNKILIPTFAIGATASIVTPLMVSCGKGTNTNDGWVDLRTRFVPSNGYYTGATKFISNDYATSVYAEEAAQKPEIFSDDYLWYSSAEISAIYDAQRELQKDFESIKEDLRSREKEAAKKAYTEGVALYNQVQEFKASIDKKESFYVGLSNFHNIRFSNVSVKALPNQQMTQYYIPLVSYTLDYDYEYDYNDEQLAVELNGFQQFSEGTKLLHAHEKGTITVENIPFVVSYYFDDLPLWEIQPNADYLEDPDCTAYDVDRYPWTVSIVNEVTTDSIDYNQVGSYIYTRNYNYDYTVKSSDEDLWTSDWKANVVEGSLEDMDFASYYFWLVKLDNPL